MSAPAGLPAGAEVEVLFGRLRGLRHPRVLIDDEGFRFATCRNEFHRERYAIVGVEGLPIPEGDVLDIAQQRHQ